MEPLANVGGVLQPLSSVQVSVLDRGFLFGDAVYEVLRVYGGRPWLAGLHFDRLARSLDAVRIRGVDLDRLQERMRATIAAGPFGEATVYIQITRGSAARSHAFPSEATPFELLFVQEFKDPYQDARRTGTRAITQPDLRWERCDIKSTNLLANVLALQAAKEAGCPEAVLCLPDGTLTEGTHSSLFGVRDGRLMTAPNGQAILPGITRDFLLNLASKLDVPVRQECLRRADLPTVSELFFSGTTSEILPVVQVDEVMIGNGKPGTVTQRLLQAYAETVRRLVES
jgi:D-alanine transaminase